MALNVTDRMVNKVKTFNNPYYQNSLSVSVVGQIGTLAGEITPPVQCLPSFSIRIDS